MVLENSHSKLSASQAILLSRYSLVDLSTFCSTILLFHVCASWWIEKKCRKDGSKPEGERTSVPRRAGTRLWYYIIFTLATSAVIIGFKIMLKIYHINLWICKSLLHNSYLESNYHIDRSQHIWNHRCISFFPVYFVFWTSVGPSRLHAWRAWSSIFRGNRSLPRVPEPHNCPRTRLPSLSFLITDFMSRSGLSQLLLFARIDCLHLYLFFRSPWSLDLSWLDFYYHLFWFFLATLPSVLVTVLNSLKKRRVTAVILLSDFTLEAFW